MLNTSGSWNAISILKIFLVSGYGLFLLVRGLFAKPGFGSWHMFVTAERCHLELYSVNEQGRIIELNPWDYLPHSAIAMNRSGLEFFLFYIRCYRGIKASGYVVLCDKGRTRLLAVEGSRVVG